MKWQGSSLIGLFILVILAGCANPGDPNRESPPNTESLATRPRTVHLPEAPIIAPIDGPFACCSESQESSHPYSLCSFNAEYVRVIQPSVTWFAEEGGETLVVLGNVQNTGPSWTRVTEVQVSVYNDEDEAIADGQSKSWPSGKSIGLDPGERFPFVAKIPLGSGESMFVGDIEFCPIFTGFFGESTTPVSGTDGLNHSVSSQTIDVQHVLSAGVQIRNDRHVAREGWAYLVSYAEDGKVLGFGITTLNVGASASVLVSISDDNKTLFAGYTFSDWTHPPQDPTSFSIYYSW